MNRAVIQGTYRKVLRIKTSGVEMSGQGGTEKILTRSEGAVSWLIFNQPEKRNAVSLDMTVAALKAIEDFGADDGQRVLVVAGAGEKAFVSGADISEFEERRNNTEAAAEYSRISTQMYDALAAVEKPTIAMIRGYCLGGGAALAASCDLRICSDDASFGIPAARMSIGYRFDFTRRIVDLVGPSFTKEMLYTARRFNAGEAAAMGFVNRVVPKAELESYVLDYAETIANNAPLSITATKVIVGELLKNPEARDLDRCDAVIAECSGSADFTEGRRAFMEKRKPVFTGK